MQGKPMSDRNQMGEQAVADMMAAKKGMHPQAADHTKMAHPVEHEKPAPMKAK